MKKQIPTRACEFASIMEITADEIRDMACYDALVKINTLYFNGGGYTYTSYAADMDNLIADVAHEDAERLIKLKTRMLAHI